VITASTKRSSSRPPQERRSRTGADRTRRPTRLRAAAARTRRGWTGSRESARAARRRCIRDPDGPPSYSTRVFRDSASKIAICSAMPFPCRRDARRGVSCIPCAHPIQRAPRASGAPRSRLEAAVHASERISPRDFSAPSRSDVETACSPDPPSTRRFCRGHAPIGSDGRYSSHSWGGGLGPLGCSDLRLGRESRSGGGR
jgi:hypothetical protein